MKIEKKRLEKNFARFESSIFDKFSPLLYSFYPAAEHLSSAQLLFQLIRLDGQEKFFSAIDIFSLYVFIFRCF